MLFCYCSCRKLIHMLKISPCHSPYLSTFSPSYLQKDVQDPQHFIPQFLHPHYPHSGFQTSQALFLVVFVQGGLPFLIRPLHKSYPPFEDLLQCPLLNNLRCSELLALCKPAFFHLPCHRIHSLIVSVSSALCDPRSPSPDLSTPRTTILAQASPCLCLCIMRRCPC